MVNLTTIFAGIVFLACVSSKSAWGTEPWTCTGTGVQGESSCLGLLGHVSTSDDGSGFSLGMDYLTQGVFSLGVVAGRSSVDEKDLGFDLSATAVGPFFGVYPLRQTPEIPLSMGFWVGYSKAWFSSDVFDALEIDVTGSKWVFGGTFSSAIDVSPTLSIVPQLGISHSSHGMTIEADSYSESDDFGSTSFNFGFGLAFRLPENQTFYLSPSISSGEDATSFGLTAGFVFDVSQQDRRVRDRPSRQEQWPGERQRTSRQDRRARLESSDRISEDLLWTMVGGIPAKTTVNASSLDYDQLDAIAEVFNVEPRSVRTFRWGITQVPGDHVHSGSTWYAVTHSQSGGTATETIRVDKLGTVLERLRY